MIYKEYYKHTQKRNKKMRRVCFLVDCCNWPNLPCYTTFSSFIWLVSENAKLFLTHKLKTRKMWLFHKNRKIRDRNQQQWTSPPHISCLLPNKRFGLSVLKADQFCFPLLVNSFYVDSKYCHMFLCFDHFWIAEQSFDLYFNKSSRSILLTSLLLKCIQ